MSFSGLFVILIVALIVVKPDRLPEVAHALGKMIHTLKLYYERFYSSFN